MITPSYGLSATERILPRLALDFTTGTLDSRVSLTRALNTATRFNSSGLIEIVNANLPRFDYTPSTLAPKGLLVEESRANLLLYSDQFNSATWSKTASVNPDQLVSPDGTTNADLVSTTGNFQYVRQLITATANAAYTVSFFVKPVSGTPTVRLYLTNGPQTEVAGSNFSLVGAGSLGTLFQVGTGVVTSRTITQLANGWYRCTLSGTVNTTSLYGYIDNHSVGTVSYGLYGAQLEAGAFATSYVPTTTASLTRNADVAAMTGTNFSSWWQPTTGSLMVRARQSIISGTRPWAYISDGTSNNIISLRGNAADPELYIKNTTDQAQIDAGTLVANTSYGLVGAWNTDNCAAAFNGGSAVIDTSAAIPTVDRMLIGSNGADYLNGWVEKISFWPQRVINAEAQAFSK